MDSATLIDHVASTHPENIPESGVLKVALSDQYAVYCRRKYMVTFKRQQEIITARKMKHFVNSIRSGSRDKSDCSSNRQGGSSGGVNAPKRQGMGGPGASPPEKFSGEHPY